MRLRVEAAILVGYGCGTPKTQFSEFCSSNAKNQKCVTVTLWRYIMWSYCSAG